MLTNHTSGPVCNTMANFKSDLFRSFAMGFGIGAVALCVVFGGGELARVAGGMVPSAVAAPVR